MAEELSWESVCREEDIVPDTGICALFNEQQVAIFKERKTNSLFAISNYDPIGKANVMSRGIIGSIGDRLVVASPLYKQHFCLRTGECLEDGHTLQTFPVRVFNGEVQLGRSSTP